MDENKVREIIRQELALFIRSDRFTFQKDIQMLDGRNFQTATAVGSKIGTGTGQRIGFWNQTPTIQPTNGANLTNNVSSGGSDDTIANYTDLSTYSNDAAAIRNNIYQLARKLKIINDSLRTIGLNS